MYDLAGRRVVILGCGYVGGALARAALARGAQVTALTRNAATAEELAMLGAAVVVDDLAGRSWHGRIAGGADMVLNCVGSGGGGLEGYRHSYVDGMRSVVEWLEGAGPADTLVYTSSTSVYPQGGGVVVDEQSETGGGERAGLLLEAEAVVRRADKARRRWRILRLAGIYGPGRHHLLDQVRTGEVAGEGTHRLNLAHRDDIVDAVLACVGGGGGEGEVFNVADGAPERRDEVVRWLARRLGVPEPRFSEEAGPRGRTGAPDRIIASAKIRGLLGWRPRHPTFREGYDSFLSRLEGEAL